MQIVALTTTKHLISGVEIVELVEGQRYDAMPERYQRELIDQGLAKEVPAKKTTKG